MKLYEVIVNGSLVGVVEIAPSMAHSIESTVDGIILKEV